MKNRYRIRWEAKNRKGKHRFTLSNHRYYLAAHLKCWWFKYMIDSALEDKTYWWVEEL